MVDEGFSGLEAAIVLIAFVAIAAVFAYATIGTGFLVTSKAQDTTSSSMKSASAGVYIDGGLYGTMTTPSGQLDQLAFYIAIPETGLAQDLTGMIMTYSESKAPIEKSMGLIADHDHFSIGSDGTVDPSQPVILYAGTKTRVNFANLQGPTQMNAFTIEVQPKTGPSFFLERYIPQGYTGGVIR